MTQVLLVPLLRRCRPELLLSWFLTVCVLVELPKFCSFPSSGLLWFWTGVANIPGSVGTGGTGDTGLRCGAPGSAGHATATIPPRGRFPADPAAADGSVPWFGPTFTGGSSV